MDEYKDIDWLDRDSNQIEGLDHLGIQAISVAMYTKLLPGITNVTDRARYFSFYPWLLSKYDPEQSGSWYIFLRRHEFLLSLASNYAVHFGKANPTYDGGAVVGSDRAKDAIAASTALRKIPLAEYTALDSKGKRGAKGSYFKNKEGGYDQYYKRQLDILRITTESGSAGIPDRDIVKQVGSQIAASVDSQSGFRDLSKFASKDIVSFTELERLSDLVPPWKVLGDSKEEQMLITSFFGLDQAALTSQDKTELSARRNSLLLLLSFLKEATAPHSIDELVYEFRWCVMFNCLPNGRPWTVNEKLAVTRNMWGIYQLQDVFNYTLENFLWAVLEALDQPDEWPSQIDALIQEMIGIVTKQFLSHETTKYIKKSVKPKTVKDYLFNSKRSSDEDSREPFGKYSDRYIFEKLRAAQEIEETLVLGTHMLCRLLSRVASPVYGLFDFDIDFLKRYPLNLEYMPKKVQAMRDLTIDAFLQQYLKEIIIKRHLKVAARKLSYQGQSTFKFIPDSGRLIRIAEKSVQPTLTSPRVRQAIRILCDLHLISFDDRGLRLTDKGERIVKECHAL